MIIEHPATPSMLPRLALAMIALMSVLEAEVAFPLPADLSAPRRDLILEALQFFKKHPEVPYLEGGADTEGMDCSGAIVSLLKLVNIEPPRSARGQYEWLKKSGRLTLVPVGELTADDPVFRSLQPGDLVFWAKEAHGTAEGFRVSHVHMYLGKEADGHAVMIGSSDGRSYRGKKISGFGIVDFRVPKPGSPTRIVGFGSPFPAADKTSTDPRPSDPSPTQP